MGGLIAKILASRYPHRVRSLAGLASHTNHRRHAVPRARLLWSMSGRDRTDHSREGVIRRNLKLCRMLGSPDYPRPDAELREVFGRAYDRDYRPDGMLRQLHGLIATPCLDELLPAITAPTQLLHGLADPLVTPINGRRAAAAIPGARLELYPGVGHDFPAELLPRWAELIAANAARA
jgi:pimeloyl-ACP methyl ester carboxylesterase